MQVKTEPDRRAKALRQVRGEANAAIPTAPEKARDATEQV